LVTQSEYFGASSWVKQNCTITSNYAISPEGVNNASRIVSSGVFFLYQLFTFTNAVEYTLSFYVKSNGSGNDSFRLYAEGNSATKTATNEWVRHEYTFTGQGTSKDFGLRDVGGSSLDILIWGTQVEVGSYPTSYIPAYGSSVTRSLDSLSKYDFSDSLSQTFFIECGKTGYTGGGGEFILEKSNPVAAIFRLYIEIDNSGTNVSRIRFRTEFPSNNYDFNLGNKDEYKKIALSIDGGNVKLFGNGSLLGTYVVTPTIMEQLNWRVQSSKFSTKQLLLFPTALTDDECIALTTI